MKNEEKARSLCCSGCNDYNCYTKGNSCVQLKNIMRMAEWKDEQFAQEKQQRYTIFKQNWREFIDKDRRETMEYVEDWLTDNTELPEIAIEQLIDALRMGFAMKNKARRKIE